MKSKTIFHLFVVIIALASCSQTEDTAVKELNDSVMTLHDELMPKTEQIIQLKTSLDSLSKGPDSVHVKKLIQSLDKADSEMMNWMHQFSIDSLSTMDFKAKLSYLHEQLNKLKTIETLTDSTLHAANQYKK
ncbi:hypothetical protein EWU23_10870 [Cytophagaceae bacterium 50C-KIRBA]|uniref:Viral A-type inclusion protein n=1 Tax=Aquirufa beregesia TaxID=2516556 RepID=A0ABX0F0E8_9BACT|nr:hypothetical protein [Aquirufa beregesia]NGZ44976.1 hypothetical protein [Aquirufa beregesia]